MFQEQTAVSAEAGKLLTIPRRHRRFDCDFEVVLRCRGMFQTVTVSDLSQSAARLTNTYGLFPGDQVQIRLPNRKTLTGRIVWSLGSNCGMAFESDQATI